MAPVQEKVRWTPGPAGGSIGSLADIQIPAGYLFVDAAGAKLMLERARNPVPRGLVGIIKPESEKWLVVLEFSDFGYVKDTTGLIDEASVLKAVWDRTQRQNANSVKNGAAPITSVDWALKPEYDSRLHMLDWAVKAQFAGGEVINHTIRLLGRRGVLDATSVQSADVSPDLVPLRELVQNIAFKVGQRYGDYQKGDKVASVGLAGLISADDSSVEGAVEESAIAGGSSFNMDLIVGLGAVLFVCTGVSVVLVRRRIQRRRESEVRRTVPAPRPAVAHVNGTNGTTMARPVPPRPELARIPRPAMNGHANGCNGHRQDKRRRMFNYQKFYSDMVLQVAGFTTPVRANSSQADPLSLYGDAMPNGTPGSPASPEAGPRSKMSEAHFELIANQKNLIDEQHRLIQEQSKLIEEKTRLIKEKNEILERQSELFERDVL